MFDPYFFQLGKITMTKTRFFFLISFMVYLGVPLLLIILGKLSSTCIAGKWLLP